MGNDISYTSIHLIGQSYCRYHFRIFYKYCLIFKRWFTSKNHVFGDKYICQHLHCARIGNWVIKFLGKPILNRFWIYSAGIHGEYIFLLIQIVLSFRVILLKHHQQLNISHYLRVSHWHVRINCWRSECWQVVANCVASSIWRATTQKQTNWL